jgi:hypothetical protein
MIGEMDKKDLKNGVFSRQSRIWVKISVYDGVNCKRDGRI